MSHTFFRKMPWEAPYVRDEKGASSGEVVGDSGGKAGECKSGNVVENVSRQSQAKGRELQKTKPKQTLPKKIPKAKPKIDGPVFSQSPIPMKKIKFRGKNLKPSSFMDEGEKDVEWCEKKSAETVVKYEVLFPKRSLEKFSRRNSEL